MDMIVVSTFFQDLDVQLITNLEEYVTIAQLNITNQNQITIFRHPSQVNLKIVHTVTTFCGAPYNVTFYQE